MKNNISVQIGELIRTARQNKKITMKTLGEKIGVSESTICRYEKGERDMTLDVFFKICEIVGLEPNDIQAALK